MHGISCVAMLATGILVGCVPANSGSASVVPAPHDSVKVELWPPAADLSGAWATGSGGEPPAGPVMTYPSCAYNPAVWIIQQTGNTLKAWLIPESFNQGIARAEPGPEKVVGAPGTISGTVVRIVDGEVRLLLRYDRESGHLVGTRDGAPFWAARQKIVRTEACPGIPDN